MKVFGKHSGRSYKKWTGEVTGGFMAGHIVEVRASGEPLPIYTIAYRAHSGGPSKLMGFAVGAAALRRHFEEQVAEIRWALPQGLSPGQAMGAKGEETEESWRSRAS